MTAGEDTTLTGCRVGSPTFSSRRSRAEDDRDDVEIELVEQPGRKKLLHGARATCDCHVPIAGGLARLCEGGLDPIGHEREGAALLGAALLCSGSRLVVCVPEPELPVGAEVPGDKRPQGTGR